MVDIDYNMLGRRLREIRKAKPLTQEKLAEKTDLSWQYISNIERGLSIPSLETVVALCRVLNITPDVLLVGTDTTAKTYMNNELTSKFDDCTAAEKQLIFDFIDLLRKHRTKSHN